MTTTATQTIRTATATTATKTLIESLAVLDAKSRIDPAERMVYAALCDEVTDRLGISDRIDSMIDNPAMDDLTFFELIMLAQVAQ